MTYIVELFSEAFGGEYYKYDTQQEAIEGAGRLYESSMEKNREDHIERMVILHVPPDGPRVRGEVA